MNWIVMGIILAEETFQLIDGPVEITLTGEALLGVALETDEITVEIDEG
jgi:hypothetical protein